MRNVEDGVTSTLLEATPRQQRAAPRMQRHRGTTVASRAVNDIVADALGLAFWTMRCSALSADHTARGAIRSTEAGMEREGNGQTAGMMLPHRLKHRVRT